MEIVGVDRRWSTGTSCSAGDKERCVSDLAALESGGVGPRIDFGVSPLSGAPMESDAFFSATVIVTQGDQARALTQAELGKQLAREDNPSGFLWPAPNAILWAAASGFAIDCPTPRMANEYEQWYLDVWACGGEGSHVLVKRHLAIQGDGTFAGALNDPMPLRSPCADNWGG